MTRPVEHYEAVAKAWLEAKPSGRPTIVVAQKWGVNYTTAVNWVKHARQLGVLPKSDKRDRRAHACPNCGAQVECVAGAKS